MSTVSETVPAPATLPGVLARPAPGDSLILVVALTAVSTSGPLIAACSVASLAIAFWRNAIASVLLLPIAFSRHRQEMRGVRHNRPAFAAGALLALHFGTWTPSLALTTVASATALVATQPIWSALLARAYGSHIPRGAWLGIGVAVAGAALITGGDVTVSSRAIEGDLLAMVGGAFAAAYVQAGSAARQSLTTTAYTAVCYSICALLLLVVCAAGGLRLHGYSHRDLLLLLLLTAGPQLMGHSFLNRVLRTTSPTVVSLAILFEVPGAALIAYGWLGQRPSALGIPGIVLLVAGVVIVVRASAATLALASPETD